jgi:hypothetical protein
MTMRRSIIRRSILMSISAACLCLSSAYGNAATAWDLISPQQFDPHSKAERIAIANDLAFRVARLADLVADQDRAELQKLEQDEARLAAAGADSRPNAELQLSVAYQHRKLVKLLADIHTALDCVVSSNTDAAEMLCWARASLLLSDEESLKLAIGTLRDNRRLPENKNLPPLIRGPEVWYDTYARGILEFILIPYLASAAPKAG